MNYNKFQKFISSLLIFLLLSSITIKIPFSGFSVLADDRDYFNLVSIIIDEDTYYEVKSEIKRYSKDISSYMENTKVVVLPISSDTKPYQIASMNEALFYEGNKAFKDVNYESSLIGTVLVGKIPSVDVYIKDNFSKTILPYVDFDDKSYIFNSSENKYIENAENKSGIKPEIWHGIISPNTGNLDDDIDSLKDYFDKNHDFYTGEGMYKSENSYMNGDKSEDLNSDYEPYVFYYDQFRETASVNYSSYSGYKLYLENKEDISYSRYTSGLADELKNALNGKDTSDILDLIGDINPDVDLESLSNGEDSLNIPDIQSRHIINNSIKSFVEIFSPGSIGELRKDIFNAGRYNDENNVNVDFSPYLINVLDIVNDQVIKELNDELEIKVDDLVQNGLSRKIALAKEYIKVKDHNSTFSNYTDTSNSINYVFGKRGGDINFAEECSIYRGNNENSGQLVEANRAYNVDNIQTDLDILKPYLDDNGFESRMRNFTAFEGYFGGNTPLNLTESSLETGNLEINNSDKKGSIIPLFDINGSKKIDDNSKLHSPLNCYENNYIEVYENYGDDYYIPSIDDYYYKDDWDYYSDTNENSRVYDFSLSFEENYKTLSASSCDKSIIELDSNKIKEVDGGSNCENDYTHTYKYKSIASYITHKSPTSSELNSQIKSGIVKNLPIDKNRYIDFIAIDGSYEKINYPYLYRLGLDKLDVNSAKDELDLYLDDYSLEINNKIDKYKVSNLSGDDSSIYNFLKTGNYPSSNFDLKKYIKDKGDKTLDIDGEQISISYYDMLVFAIYWNNLENVSSKYAFIFDNYLSNQVEGDNDYYLPKNKKQYEISYLGAPGFATDMFIGLDPEAKVDNPYSDIISQNQDLSSKLLGLKVSSSNYNSKKSDTSCAPPGGVSLMEWFPAIICRLDEMLPPKISLTEGSCGQSLLTQEEREEINSCNGDVNKNGINDCQEEKLSLSDLVLNSDSSKYFYNTKADLKSSIISSDGKLITYLNNLEVSYEVVTVDFIETNGVKTPVYDKNDIDLDDKSLYSDYITFNDIKNYTNGGESRHSILFKNKDIDVAIKSYISILDNNGNEEVRLDSDTLVLEVRGNTIFSQANKLTRENGDVKISQDDYILANSNSNIYLIDENQKNLNSISSDLFDDSASQEKIVFSISNYSSSGNNTSLSYPLTVKLFSGDDLISTNNINSSDMNNFYDLYSLSESGEYKIQIIDSNGVFVYNNFSINAGEVNSVDINLGSNYVEKGSVITTNFVTLYDVYGNPVNSRFYDLDLKIDGKGLLFNDNETNKLKISTHDGYSIFRLLSTDKKSDNEIIIDVLDVYGNIITSSSKDIKVIDNLNIETKSITGDFSINKTGNKLQVEIRNENGDIYRGFNSRVYMTLDPIYGELKSSYFTIDNGVGVVEFDTSTISGKQIPVEFQIEGLGQNYNSYIDILPGDAMKMDISLSDSKIEASENSYSILNVELKDVYNNLVFTDDTTKINIEVLEKYSSILKPDTFSSISKGGKSTFKLYATDTPGVGYFKVYSEPSLSTNTFTIGEGDDKITISGVGENAGKIETFYLWNKEKIEGNNYNSLYTTLLGSNYGDYEQVDYLAGSLIFDDSSRALSVTSLISNPYNVDNTFLVSKNAGFESLFNGSDLTQDINYNLGLDNNNLYINIFNKSLNTYIGQVYYNLGDNLKFGVCEDVLSCIENTNKSSIIGKNTSEDFDFYLDGGSLFLNDKFGKTYIEINEDGEIIKKQAIDLELSSSSNKNYLSVDLLVGNNIVGNLNISLKDNIDTNITRDFDLFKRKIESTSNNVILYLDSYTYGYYNSGNGVDKKTVVYYKDPFASDTNLSEFTKGNLYGYENFEKQSGLGWKDENKTLLSFSSGLGVGESVKNYQSFYTINIGDPVISLKDKRNKFNDSSLLKQFDSTIGELIIKDDNISGYKIFDYNNDGIDDILLIKKDGFLSLLEGADISTKYINKGNLAYISDIGSLDMVEVGDFTGDKFDDIFFVGDDGNPYLLNNINKDFSRFSLLNKFDLNARIVRSETFDMDNDSIDDIITLDDSGSLNIFYGGGFSSNPSFEKNTISNSFGISLDTGVRSDGGLVYFDGLYQVDYELDPSNLDNQNEIYINNIINADSNSYSLPTNKDSYKPENISNTLDGLFGDLSTGDKTIETIDENLYNNLIFEKVSYDKSNQNSSDVTIDQDSSEIETYTFVKSEYSDYSGIKVEKYTKDRNGENVQIGDIVDLEIVLTNTSNKNLNNIAYIEDINEVFLLENNSITNSLGFPIKEPNNSSDFLIDGFFLRPQETFTINYSAKVRPFSHSHIEVGLFERGEDGDDLFGDILIKENKQNCSEINDIFRSVSNRTYSRGFTQISCDDSELPEEIKKNTIDNDTNGIPDYIDELTKNPATLENFASEELGKIYQDDDGDGIPNGEDSFNGENGIIGDLNKLELNINNGLDKLQNSINSLSCGFNNGGCIATPLNWAPLAPGNDPTFNGYPIGDGLKVNEGIPVFSALTGFPGPFGIPIPGVWPPFPGGFPAYSSPGAGGYLGVTNPANFIRIFVTPTLTGGIGTAICFGGPAIVAGNTFLPGLSPLVPGGNCIVTAKPFLGCSSDGSGGNPASIGNPTYGGDFGFINGNCNKINSDNYVSSDVAEEYYAYLSGKSFDKTLVSNSSSALSDHSSTGNGPLFSIGSSGTEVSVNYDTSDGFDYSDVEEFTQKRVQSYPGFIMNWITAQIEEIATKLTDFPNLYIILPDMSSIFGNSADEEIEDAISVDNDFGETGDSLKKVNSGIADVYSFIGSLPIVNVEQENMNVYLPSLSESEVNKVIKSRNLTIEQWENELKRFTNEITFGESCSLLEETEKIEACEKQYSKAIEISGNMNSLISSAKKNIEVIESYANLPEEIGKLIEKKEDYLEQIMCNVEALGGNYASWIDRNGERFKSWVELYILIKAILKSWQALVDVFIGYEQECKECKNERGDSLTFQFELISMIIPSMPIIKFPKWPDIILDLHNIRAGIDIVLPQINVEPRTINLPDLPNIYLPDLPNININFNFPELPILPQIELPILPDLPTFPSFELPDLPPAPLLPKLFSELKGFLNILKLITKAMCILKSSPFVPEWRAGDQIAFLTERSGYLSTDFVNISLPQYSYPVIDAVEIKSYVNLQASTDYINDIFRMAIEPFNDITGDYSNMFNLINVNDLDLRNTIKSEIDVDVNLNLDDDIIDINSSYNNNQKLGKIASLLAASEFAKGYTSLSKNNKETISNLEFKQNMSEFLASETVTKDPKLDELREIWNNVNNYSFSKENETIDELYKFNIDKFSKIKDILNNELIINKNLEKKLDNPFILKISDNNSSLIDSYKKEMSYFNEITKGNIENLYSYEDNESKELENIKDNLVSNVKTALGNYNDSNLLAANTTSTSTANSCSATGTSTEDYSYNYEGIYILDSGKSYRLFDYLDELDGNEETTIIDFDRDGDDDLLYFVNGSLYLKENHKITDSKTYLGENPLIIDFGDNKFSKEDNFISSVDNFEEGVSANNRINLSFLGKESINTYRLGLYTVVDKYLNEKNPTYNPIFRKKTILDAVSGVGEVNKVEENNIYTEFKNTVYIDNYGDLNGVKLDGYVFKNIKEDIDNGNIIFMSSGNKIYSGGNVSILKYIFEDDEIKSIIIPKNSYIQFNSTVKIVGVTGDTFITNGEKKTYSGAEISFYKGLNLLEGNKIYYEGNDNDVKDDSYIDLKYYNNSELSIEFEYDKSWELYDLGDSREEYNISISKNNDYYYAKIFAFDDEKISSLNNQILLSPQVQSDDISPELYLDSLIVPVYQEKTYDLTDYIFDDGGINSIGEIYMDFDLEVDSDGDGDLKNDRDSENMDNILFDKTSDNLNLVLGKFDTIFEKNIGITIKDLNNNTTFKELKLEVYSPVPQISSFDENKLYGTINEELQEEPVSIFRYRAGSIKQLKDANSNSFSLTSSGSYDFEIDENTDGLSIELSGEKIAYIDDITGKITKGNQGISINVIKSNSSLNDLVYPKITLNDTSGNEVYYQTMKVSDNKSVVVLDDFIEAKENGLYVMFLNKLDYNYYILPENISFNPGILSIYRTSNEEKEALFTIFPDGRINTANDKYDLEYSTYGDYIIFKLFDRHFSREVARVLYKVSGEYLIK